MMYIYHIYHILIIKKICISHHLKYIVCWWALELLLCLGYLAMYLFELLFSFFSINIYPGVEFLDHIVILFLVFWGTSVLFPIVAVPICIPTNSVQGYPFLHILSSPCSLYFLWWPVWNVGGAVSLFWFAFL